MARSPTSRLSNSEIVDNFKPRSRMQVNRKAVLDYQLKQMEEAADKKKRDKIVDLAIGKIINKEAAI